jgi:hypothetical protein
MPFILTAIRENPPRKQLSVANPMLCGNYKDEQQHLYQEEKS